ncbi:hypothetical protein BV898_14836 [Hypsibius exemplaris]|uniref:Uncharacterized protein n=1 Tax=Hypsibius exemplaris TaxID=2072580 RepID=A0A9X6RK56_HYPEX|nr:hypothetical protein BV898_14836 [Hypsibius exemplaris]
MAQAQATTAKADRISETDGCTVDKCSILKLFALVRKTTDATAATPEAKTDCSFCVENSKVKYVLAGSAAVIALAAAPTVAAGATVVLGVTKIGPLAGGATAALMHYGAPVWLPAVIQSVGMAGLGVVGKALLMISAGGGVLFKMDGKGYTCVPIPCATIPGSCKGSPAEPQ